MRHETACVDVRQSGGGFQNASLHVTTICLIMLTVPLVVKTASVPPLTSCLVSLVRPLPIEPTDV